MNYLIIGAGAIGTYIGGSLLKSGSEVMFLERESVIQALKNEGLKLNLESGVFMTSDFQVFSDLNQALQNPIDILIFAMKSFDTEEVVEGLVNFRDRFKAVLCLQNGVENEQMIANYLGAEKVIGGSLTSAIQRGSIGQASLEKKRGIGVVDSHHLSRSIVEDFNRAKLNAKLYPKLEDLKWSKMLSNLLGNATSAILNMTPAQLFKNTKLYEIEIIQMKEAVQVMAILGIHSINLPGVPMKLLLQLMLKLPRRLSRIILAKLIGSGRGEKMPSFHIDLHSGQTKLESYYLNGAICRFGDQVDVPTPVNHILSQMLSDMTLRRDMIKEYDHEVDRLYEEIQKKL